MVLVVGAGYLGNGETDVIFTGLRLSPMQWVRNCRTRRQFQEKWKWEEEEKSNCFEKKSKAPDVEFSMWKMTMWAAYMGMKICKRNILMQNQHIYLYLRWWWWGWAEKRDKGVSPVPAAAVVALESELTVASTNAAPTLLLVVIWNGCWFLSAQYQLNPPQMKATSTQLAIENRSQPEKVFENEPQPNCRWARPPPRPPLLPASAAAKKQPPPLHHRPEDGAGAKIQAHSVWAKNY